MKNFGTSLIKEISGQTFDNISSEAHDVFSSVFRCKGELWLCNADCCPIDIHSVGRQLVLQPASRPWMMKVLEEHPNGNRESENPDEDDCEAWDAVDLDTEVLAELKAAEQWDERFGDRRSEIVLIGIRLDKEKITKELKNALLTDTELNVHEKDRKKAWADDLKDHFFEEMPLWDLQDILGVEEPDMCATPEED